MDIHGMGLGKLLLSGNFFNQEKLDDMAKSCKESGESILEYAVKSKAVDSQKVAIFLSNKFNLPFFDVDFLNESSIVDIDVKLIEKHKFLPIKKTVSSVHILTSDPSNQTAVSEVKFNLNVQNVQTIVVADDKLRVLIEKYLHSKGTNFAKELEGSSNDIFVSGSDDDKPSDAENEVDDAPVVKFIQKILLDAVRLRVSDIHFEPYEKYYRVRYRLDGSLYEVTKVPLNLKEKIASRVKVISRMNIAEKRVPQDGRTKLIISKDRAIDFRVSTLPTLFGEKIVMRILDSSAASLNIDALGYEDLQKQRLLEAVQRPYGMVLVTGPTGSGKTVSLYSCLSVLNKDGVNIATAEDPAEIQLPGINQVNVDEKSGLTFAVALKSFLRQDPDIIMVGEIRDLETADIAIKAAQTGHMVLSTLHTNDAPSTLTRLMNMGVAPFNIASSVVLITAQRLARKLCNSCKKESELPVETLFAAGFDEENVRNYGKDWFTYHPVGCSECGDKGYRGRIGIYQVMPITEDIQRLILANATVLDIADAAKKDGVLSLRDAGLKKVIEGVTSLEEIEACTNI